MRPTESLKIAVLAPAWFAVPPVGYGGIEWIVWLLADGLADAGHDVTLFASGDSRTKAKLAAVFPEAPSKQIGRTFWELKHALSCFARADEFDVINDHTGMLGMTLGATTSTPVVHTVHGPLNGEPGEIYELISRVAPEVGLISISALTLNMATARAIRFSPDWATLAEARLVRAEEPATGPSWSLARSA